MNVELQALNARMMESSEQSGMRPTATFQGMQGQVSITPTSHMAVLAQQSQSKPSASKVFRPLFCLGHCTLRNL